MPGFIASGDNHLRRCAWSGRNSLAGDAYISFLQTVDICLAEKINLLILGDLFDSNKPPSEAVKFLQTQVHRLHAAGLSAFSIDGNHDLVDATDSDDDPLAAQLQGIGATPTPSWHELVEGLEYVDNRVFEPTPGVKAFGLNYRPAYQLEKALAQIDPAVSVLAMHQMLDLAMPIPGRWNLKAEWVPPYIKLALMADYHVEWEAEHGNTRFYYSGSSCMQDLAESPKKSVLHVLPDLSVRRIPIKSRPFLALTIDSPAALEQFLLEIGPALENPNLNELPELIRKPILKVTFFAGLKDAYGRITESIGNKAHLWLCPYALDGLEPDSTLQLAGTTDEVVSIESVLADYINPTSKTKLFELGKELLKRPKQAQQILQQYRQDSGVEAATVAVVTA